MTAASPSTDVPKSPPKVITLVAIVLALSAPLITAFLNSYFAAWFDNNGRVLAGMLSFLAITGLVLLLVRFEPVSALDNTQSVWGRIGFKPVKLRPTLIVLILAFVTLFIVSLAFVVLSRTILPTEIKTSAALKLPLPLLIFVYLAGSISEEILYRGYALERLQRITGNWWISGGITWALFVGFHIPAYPMAHIVGTVAPATVVITLLYIRTRNLTYTTIFHAVLNVPILLAAVLMALLQAGS
jgi:membrane protease YdiL (CAAX protease family)